jgi:hypothetical protein
MPPPNAPPASSTPKPSSASTSATQKPAVQPSKSQGSLPGKGPKTFEEMGVPTAQKDNDCVCPSPFSLVCLLDLRILTMS